MQPKTINTVYFYLLSLMKRTKHWVGKQLKKCGCLNTDDSYDLSDIIKDSM